jgi:hypothetical protein
MRPESDFDRLGRQILETLRAHPEEFGEPAPLERLPPPPAVPGLPAFVLESEAGLLLGDPPARSLSLALPVTAWEAGESLAWCFGESLAAAAGPRPRDFLQVVLVESPEPATRASLSGIASLRSLTGRLPGWLAHSFEGETTARVHRSLLAAGLTQGHLAHAHLAQARARGFSRAVGAVVGLPSPRALELFEPLRAELKRLRASLAAASTAAARQAEGCEGKSCSSCDERVVCDKVRAVLAARARTT